VPWTRSSFSKKFSKAMIKEANDERASVGQAPIHTEKAPPRSYRLAIR
jgi:hypothetical protein